MVFFLSFLFLEADGVIYKCFSSLSSESLVESVADSQRELCERIAELETHLANSHAQHAEMVRQIEIAKHERERMEAKLKKRERELTNLTDAIARRQPETSNESAVKHTNGERSPEVTFN